MKYILPDKAYDYFLATLSNRNRLKILNELLAGDKNVSELTSKLKVDQSTVSNNLKRLYSCGFVNIRAKGKERIYSINKETIQPLVKLINKHTKKYCTKCINRNYERK